MKESLTIVVFRKWREIGTVIALFPELPSDLYGYFCDAYEHVGQHGGADYFGVVQQTTPATSEESDGLTEELTRIGYCLKPIQRASWRHHQKRRMTADRNRC